MPPVTSGKVLVTGANGYIATWVIHKLLEQDYSVRGAVRSESKATLLRKAFAAYGDRFETTVVEDITKAGAFDEAVKGIDAVEHTASPVYIATDDPDEVIVPAVHGTTRVLESALAYGSNVKRVVYTSACATIVHVQDAPYTFSEADWNDAVVAEVKEKGRAASQLAKYRASKTLAEKAAWEFVEKNKSKIGWDLVVLNPPYVFGPPIHDVAQSPEDLNASMRQWFQSVLKGPELLIDGGMCWTDVRDLAEAHVLAIQKQEAGGERIIVSEGPFKWQDFAIAASKQGIKVFVNDDSYNPTNATHHVIYDTSKIARIFGLKFRSIEESTADIIDDLRARGWI
ncbi:uncharacterized protein FIBRA_06416 [Fibroporia radiculosa]|uniref:NAD-dependent epimerase/dehydratase domain-containing protein n=1 Tax=Fibroporia radiculosa TaxID=599839 RepID=J4H424_9APHY|nr:uncharacterized protein FIBRA_06416 [Fibroporia radiculosa]CCM04249.1 predicted protein [Fibroporia radiculosa]